MGQESSHPFCGECEYCRRLVYELGYPTRELQQAYPRLVRYAARPPLPPYDDYYPKVPPSRARPPHPYLVRAPRPHPSGYYNEPQRQRPNNYPTQVRPRRIRARSNRDVRFADEHSENRAEAMPMPRKRLQRQKPASRQQTTAAASGMLMARPTPVISEPSFVQSRTPNSASSKFINSEQNALSRGRAAKDNDSDNNSDDDEERATLPPTCCPMMTSAILGFALAIAITMVLGFLVKTNTAKSSGTVFL